MFEAVLKTEGLPPRRLGGALGVALLVQGACVMLAVTFGAGQKIVEEVVAEVKFVAARPPPPPPPPPPPAARTAQRPTPRERPKTKAPRPELVKPVKSEPEPEPEPTTPAEEMAEAGVEGGGVEGGVEGGVPGGVVGGVIGGVLPQASAGETVPFSEEMGKPELLSGDPPQYTPEALAQGASGLMLVKCVITHDGLLDRCRIIKPVPGMEEAVLSALKTYRYRPILVGGRAMNVEYLLKFRFVPPSR